MSMAGLERALPGDLTAADWLRILNGKVFFWLTRERLELMMSARAYRDLPKTVLQVATGELLANPAPRVLLAPMNTGATKPYPWPRGRDTFRPLSEYPLQKRKRRRSEPVVEFAVQGAFLDISAYVLRVVEVRPGQDDKVLWQRGSQNAPK